MQRQVFEAFEPQILYDKAERKIEISANVSEAVADAFEKQKAHDFEAGRSNSITSITHSETYELHVPWSSWHCPKGSRASHVRWDSLFLSCEPKEGMRS